jgi:hypothetical protein
MKLISLTQAAQIMSIGRYSVESLINTGKLKAVKCGSRWKTCRQWIKELQPEKVTVTAPVNLLIQTDMAKFQQQQREIWLGKKKAV